MKTNKNNEMRAEYNFSKAERGKFYRPLDKGYTIRVHKSDGTTVVNHYTLTEGAILLAPDVLEYFPDSEAVNEALRSLIYLMKKIPVKKNSARKNQTGGRRRQESKKRNVNKTDLAFARVRFVYCFAKIL
jgi:hypothetical protein